jgi:hypothetical protein
MRPELRWRFERGARANSNGAICVVAAVRRAMVAGVDRCFSLASARVGCGEAAIAVTAGIIRAEGVA